jgi:hypothetical protein
LGNIYIVEVGNIIMDGQPINVGTISNTPLIQQEFLKWLNDPDSFYIWLQHTLRGEVLKTNEKKEEFWELPYRLEIRMVEQADGEKKPFEFKRYLTEQMTEEGAISITNKLRPFLNQFTFHADYTDDQISDMIIPIVTEFDIYLKRNQRNFGISDDNISTIAISIKSLIFTAFKMSRMRDFYTDVLKIGIGSPQNEKKDKVLGIFPRP